MKFRMFPKEQKFFELFRRDAANLKEGALALQELIDHYEDVEAKYESIKRIEPQGDNITHEIFAKLRETFITPLEREDIHDLASGLDDVLDCIEGVASRMCYFKLPRPPPEVNRPAEIKDLIKLKEIYTRLEIAADRCEDVANVIEGIIVKSS